MNLAKKASKIADTLRVIPGQALRLTDIDPNPPAEFDKEQAEEHTENLRKQLSDYQEKLFAEHRRSLLLVFQAIDTGGKDGAISNLLTGVNPAGVEVTSFKRPSEEELSHDFLWRVHQHTPGRGFIGVFNRSHYEDVLVTRVHKLIGPDVWQPRYQDINNFEQLLTRNGTRIIKFFLYISKEEQAERLQSRLDNPDKLWKYEPGDLEERKLWDDYQEAFQDALAATSTADAPWYVIPANNKKYRDLVLTQLVTDALAEMDPQPPAADFNVEAQVIQ